METTSPNAVGRWADNPSCRPEKAPEGLPLRAMLPLIKAAWKISVYQEGRGIVTE